MVWRGKNLHYSHPGDDRAVLVHLHFTGFQGGVSMAVMFESTFPRGKAPLFAYGPLDDQAAPLVLLFMDAFGPRPTLDRIAERLASEGYRVVMPDLFYDHLPYVPLNPKSVFGGGDDRQRLMAMFGVLDQSKIDADVRALARFLHRPIRQHRTDWRDRLLHGRTLCPDGRDVERSGGFCRSIPWQQPGTGERRQSAKALRWNASADLCRCRRHRSNIRRS